MAEQEQIQICDNRGVRYGSSTVWQNRSDNRLEVN